MSLRPNDNLVVRQKSYKKVVGAEEGRRRREDDMIQIRKNKREENLSKKRRNGDYMTVDNAAAADDDYMTVDNAAAAADDDDDDSDYKNDQRRNGDYMTVDNADDDDDCDYKHDQLLMEQLRRILPNLGSEDITLQLETATQYRDLISRMSIQPIHVVIQWGVVPYFVKFLERDDNPRLQYEALWALTNMTSGISNHVQVVIEHGAVPMFARLLNSPINDVRELAVCGLGYLAECSTRYRDLVLRQGALTALLAQFNEHTTGSILQHATQTLSVFCGGIPTPDFEQIQPALPVLARLIHSNDERVLRRACETLKYFSYASDDKIQAVIDAGVCPRLVELLSYDDFSIFDSALLTVCNIVCGGEKQIQVMIEHQVLPSLLNFLTQNHCTFIQITVCRTISNITKGTKEQIQAVIQAGVIGPLVQLCLNAELMVAREAAWAISTAISGATHEQIRYVVSQGCIQPLCDRLKCYHPETIIACLEALENILMVGENEKNMGNTGDVNVYAQLIDEAGGLEKIENLQRYNNNEIYQKAVNIIESYWSDEDNDELAGAIT